MHRPCYFGPRLAHPPCSPDGSRARTENHPARLCKAGHGSLWHQEPSGRGGLRRGGAGDFLGPGPWQIVRWGGGYRETPDPDPVYLYTDDVIGILPERNLNNGQPSLHAALIVAAAPPPGEHVGAGVGYYTT